MVPKPANKIPDYFGDDEEDVLDIQCRPARSNDFPQVAFLTVKLLDKLFSPIIGPTSNDPEKLILNALQARLRHDCTWVMTEGDKIIGVLEAETVETRLFNGLPLPRILAGALNLVEKIRDAGLLPILMHEPEPEDAHLSIVSMLPGSRGEGRGTLLLMHGAFWAKAQGKDWITTWLKADDPARFVYDRRGYFIESELDSEGPHGTIKWVFLKKPISSKAHKIRRLKAHK